LDLMQKLLHFNPNKRMSADEALKHPYVAAFHNVKDEPASSGPITISLPDDTRYTVSEYRERLYAEIVSKKRQERPREVGGPVATPATRERDTTGVASSSSAQPGRTVTGSSSSSAYPRRETVSSGYGSRAPAVAASGSSASSGSDPLKRTSVVDKRPSVTTSTVSATNAARAVRPASKGVGV
jgi:mitogen-activated protein kinase 15